MRVREGASQQQRLSAIFMMCARTSLFGVNGIFMSLFVHLQQEYNARTAVYNKHISLNLCFEVPAKRHQCTESVRALDSNKKKHTQTRTPLGRRGESTRFLPEP